jgi:hypothetical protein
MQEYVEIEDVRKLSACSKSLATNLRKIMVHKKRRTIGYPAGNFTDDVRFISDQGDDVFWWAGRASDNGENWLNVFGHGDPGNKNAMLNIDVQINIPIKKFSRRLGGAFLSHIATDTTVVAHRGIVTLGHGRVEKSKLFAEMFSTLREASGSDHPHEFMVIGDMDSPTIVNDIETFSVELRRTVQAMRAADASNKQVEPGSGIHPSVGMVNFDALGDYFDEFGGERKVGARKNTIADCYHGTVVRALRDFFADNHVIKKTGAIDLIVDANEQVFLFEVKTASDPQSIYTAIGQLVVHSSGLAKVVQDKPIIKVIVLPALPAYRLNDALTTDLGVRVLTFTRSDRGVIRIDGLTQLVA